MSGSEPPRAPPLNGQPPLAPQKSPHPKNGTRPPEGSREARRTGLEPATTGVTGRYSNQLSYRPSLNFPLTETGETHSGEPLRRYRLASPGLPSSRQETGPEAIGDLVTWCPPNSAPKMARPAAEP